MDDLKVPILKLEHAHDLPLPAYASPQSAGMDLLAAVLEKRVLKKGERMLVPCGIALALPEGFEAQVRPRSGLALKHGVTLLNAPGTIDADYRGEVGVILVNMGTDDFTIERGMRIAQIVIAPVVQITWRETQSLPESARGSGGFGSTGLQSVSGKRG